MAYDTTRRHCHYGQYCTAITDSTVQYSPVRPVMTLQTLQYSNAITNITVQLDLIANQCWEQRERQA
jgi:hypothetical protein